MEYIDYYKVLGVERDAPQEAIAKAYKRLARKHHPDLNKAAGAEARFKQVNEAYEVLKDPEKRRRYDAFGASWKHGAPFEPPPGFRGGTGFGGADFGGADLGGFSDFFSMLFGGGGGGRRRKGAGVSLEDLLGGAGAREVFGRGHEAGPRGGDVESTLTVQLEDLYHARKLSVQLEGESGRRRYAVTIPAGTRDGERIRLVRQGARGRGGVQGDLYLTVRVAPHALYRVDGDDLEVQVPVPAWDAALGTRLPVPTFDGEVQMTLPPGLDSGQRLRIRGKGLPRRGGGRGDLFARLQIVVPKQLSPEQEQLFLKLRAAGAQR